MFEDNIKPGDYVVMNIPYYNSGIGVGKIMSVYTDKEGIARARVSFRDSNMFQSFHMFQSFPLSQLTIVKRA